MSIDKRYPGHARKIMNAFWGLGQLMFSKTIIVVDKDVDVQDLSQVAWIVGTHYDPLRDVQMTKGPVDDLDDAADLPAFGGKMGIDATRNGRLKATRGPGRRVATTEAAGPRCGGCRKLRVSRPVWTCVGADTFNRRVRRDRRRVFLSVLSGLSGLSSRRHSKSTAVVFAPLITTPTRSPSAGSYARDNSAANAADPPGSATMRKPSHNARCARRIASSVTSTTRSTCAAAIGNISAPT